MLIACDRFADLYSLYVTADYDVPFFLAEVARTKGAALELTAGTGRPSLPMIEAGAKLTCVEASQGMLDVLARKLAARGLRADLRCADVSRLEQPGDNLDVGEASVMRKEANHGALHRGGPVAARRAGIPR